MRIILSAKCRNCENWTKVEMDVQIGVEIHLGCSVCGHDVATFKTIKEKEQ